MTERWIRTCQECGHPQEDKEPKGKMTSAYQDRKCKQCGSMGLDYGKWVDDNGDE